jgi:peptidoglycan/xylan/chitin deacetylase (PgdA/CDA1 family)
MIPTRPLASLSLDLDNQWAYMKTHGEPGWESFPSYLDIVVPRVLQFLKDRNLTITFFVVGQDAALEKNREALAALTAAGHEIGNHSFGHEPWLHLFSESQIDQELSLAEDAIVHATGKHPIGFRGPGFSLSLATLRVLQRRGYLYDASTFPTFIGPLARAYYLRSVKLSAEEKRRLALLYGGFRDGFRPLHPYRWRLDTGELLEIPVTTMPLLRIPIHVSYLHYLTGYSREFALFYFKSALRLCRLTRTQPSILFHPLDFLGREDLPAFSFFPGMNLSRSEKMGLLSQILAMLSARYVLVSLETLAHSLSHLPVRKVSEASFPTASVTGVFSGKSAG